MANDSELINVFVEPGGFFVGNAAYRLRTLLGSCLSVTLWHPERRIGAMTHFVLPERLGPVRTLDARYGEEAMWQLLLELARLDVAPDQCQAKLFGGNVLWRPGPAGEEHHPHGDAARRWLRAYGIPVVSENLFGSGYRQLVFEIASGEVWSRLLEAADENLA